MILATEEVITASLKAISAATKVILVTNNLMSAPKNVNSDTASVILITKEAITVLLKVI